VRRPQGGDSGEWVTQLERSLPPTTGPDPPRAPRVREQSGLAQIVREDVLTLTPALSLAEGEGVAQRAL